MTPQKQALDFYREYGPNTDPGEYAPLYQGLPESFEDLCALIKAQLIHPAVLEQYADALPEGRKREDANFYSVHDMLEVWLEREGCWLDIGLVHTVSRDRLRDQPRYRAARSRLLAETSRVPAASSAKLPYPSPTS